MMVLVQQSCRRGGVVVLSSSSRVELWISRAAATCGGREGRLHQPSCPQLVSSSSAPPAGGLAAPPAGEVRGPEIVRLRL